VPRRLAEAFELLEPLRQQRAGKPERALQDLAELPQPRYRLRMTTPTTFSTTIRTSAREMKARTVAT
jgi:hypothetical protein